MNGRDRVPELRQPRLRPVAGANRHRRGKVPASPLRELSPVVYDDPGSRERGTSDTDAGTDGAADIFRADAIRLGFIAPNATGPDARHGLTQYLRHIGVMSERAYKRISRHEITGLAIEDIGAERDCGY